MGCIVTSFGFSIISTLQDDIIDNFDSVLVRQAVSYDFWDCKDHSVWVSRDVVAHFLQQIGGIGHNSAKKPLVCTVSRDQPSFEPMSLRFIKGRPTNQEHGDPNLCTSYGARRYPGRANIAPLKQQIAISVVNPLFRKDQTSSPKKYWQKVRCNQSLNGKYLSDINGL